MAQRVEVINYSTVARSIEFINNLGAHDSCTVHAKDKVLIDEECILTSKEDLVKRGLVIVNVGTSTPKVATVAPAPQAEKQSKQNTAPVVNESTNKE